MANDHGLGFQLTRRATLSPARTALIFRDEQWTYAELNQLVNRVANGLHALGVNPGDRVGFLGLNHPRFFFTLFATAKLGAIFVPLNFRLTGPELTFIIGDAGLHTLVYEEHFASIIDEIRADLLPDPALKQNVIRYYDRRVSARFKSAIDVLQKAELFIRSGIREIRSGG